MRKVSLESKIAFHEAHKRANWVASCALEGITVTEEDFKKYEKFTLEELISELRGGRE